MSENLKALTKGWISGAAHSLKLTEEVEDRAMLILDRYSQRVDCKVYGNKYIVSGALYVAAAVSKQPRSQLKIAEVMDVARITVKKYGDRIGQTLFWGDILE